MYYNNKNNLEHIPLLFILVMVGFIALIPYLWRYSNYMVDDGPHYLFILQYHTQYPWIVGGMVKGWVYFADTVYKVIGISAENTLNIIRLVVAFESTLLIFLILKRILNNHKYALAGSFIFSISAYQLIFANHVFRNSLANLFLLTFIFIFAVSTQKNEFSKKYILLLALTGVGVLATHKIAAVVLLLSLCLYAVVSVGHNKLRLKQLTMCVVGVIGLIFSLSFVSLFIYKLGYGWVSIYTSAAYKKPIELIIALILKVFSGTANILGYGILIAFFMIFLIFIFRYRNKKEVFEIEKFSMLEMAQIGILLIPILFFMVPIGWIFSLYVYSIGILLIIPFIINTLKASTNRMELFILSILFITIILGRDIFYGFDLLPMRFEMMACIPIPIAMMIGLKNLQISKTLKNLLLIILIFLVLFQNVYFFSEHINTKLHSSDTLYAITSSSNIQEYFSITSKDKNVLTTTGSTSFISSLFGIPASNNILFWTETHPSESVKILGEHRSSQIILSTKDMQLSEYEKRYSQRVHGVRNAQVSFKKLDTPYFYKLYDSGEIEYYTV